MHYLHIYFSMEPQDELFSNACSDDKGVYIDPDIWRKEKIIDLNVPFMVAGRACFMI